MREKNLIKTITLVLLYLCWVVFSSLFINLSVFKLNNNIISLYEFLSTFLLLIIAFLSYKSELIDEFKKLDKKSIKLVIKNFIVIFIIMNFFNILSYLILDDNIVMSLNNFGISIIKTNNLFLIIRLIIISPIIEEFIFRKSVRKIIDNNMFFILFSGLLLGFLYVLVQVPSIIGILSSLSYIFVGLYLSYIYTKTNNVYINILSRIIYNLLIIMVVLI